MSGSRESNDDRGIGGEEGEIVISTEVEERGQQHQQQQQKESKGQSKRIRKARNLFLYPFRKANNLYSRKNGHAPSSSSSFSSCSSSSYPFYYGERPIGGCYLCFLEPPVASDSPMVPTQNNPKPSSYEFVKNLIERNDFYAPECNFHRDVRGKDRT